MADAVEVAIESALINRLLALTLSPVVTVSLPSAGTALARTFTPPAAVPGANWLRATFFPADSFALGVAFDSTNQHSGFLQVDVFGYQGDGELAPGRIAASVIAWFKRGTVVTKDGFSARVTKPPFRKTMVRDDPWVMIPVSVPYLAFAPNPA